MEIVGLGAGITAQGRRQDLLEPSLHTVEASHEGGVLVDPVVVGAKVGHLV